MGVKLLHTFVRKHFEALAQQVEVPPSSTNEQQPRRVILADAYGFLISLAEEVFLQEEHVTEFVDSDVVGGELHPVDQALQCVVRRLDADYNVRLVFAVDGPRGLHALVSDRDAVWEHRAQEQQEALLQQMDYCQGLSAFKFLKRHRKRPMPRMLMTQLFATLRRSGVPVLQLDDEVDSYIGALVHELNPVCVLTSDTDLMVTPGIPVVMNCDFPFEVLLRCREGNVGDGAPSLLLPVVDAARLAAHLQLTVDELLVAASLTGNDVTAPDLRSASQHGGIEKSAAAVRKQRRASESDDVSAGHSNLVRTSVERYQRASRRILYAPSLPDDVKVVFEAFASRNIPVSLVSLLVTGLLVDDAMPLLNGLFGFVHDLKSFRTMRFAVAHMLGRSELHVVERGGVLPPSSAKGMSTRAVSVELPESIRSTLPHWSEVASIGNVDFRVACIANVFSMVPGVGLSLLPTARGASDGALLLVMWTLHSALVDRSELEMVVAMMVVVRAAVRDGDAAAQHLLLHLPRQSDGDDNRGAAILRKRPRVRVLELSMLFAVAYGDTSALLKLMDLSDALAFPEPMHVFSGTLLHALSYFGPLTRERLSATVGSSQHSYDALLTSIHGLMEKFDASFEDIAFRSQDPVSANADGFEVRTVAVSRIYSWAGVLQRDEVIDTLEAGGTSQVVMRVPASGRQVAAVENPYAAAAVSNASASTAAPQEALLPAPQPSSSSTSLPIDEHIPTILAKLNDHRVLCIQGDTGCGKSSMIPLHVYLEAKRHHRKVRIVVTQPRRLAAVALANRVASLLGETVGDSVGYRLGGGAHVESHNTSIFFVTSGYLLESLVHGSNIWARTTHLMLDEVHERSLDADMLSLVLRLMLDHDDDDSLQTRARSKRLIVMSATIQSEMFMNYFQPLSWDGTPPPLLHVGGKHRRVTEMFLPDMLTLLRPVLPADVLKDLDAYLTRVERCKGRAAFALRPTDIRSICHVVLACVKEATCILVFLPGLKEIEDAFEELSRRSTCSPVALRVHALHSIVDAEEQQQVLIPATSDECKVVLSTNIAETSITIPDVKIVVDLGFSRRVAYDEEKGLRCIQCGWCSKAAARQRAGRAGRVSDGHVMRLYTERVMAAIMPEFDGSDFYPLEASVLQVQQHLGSYGDVQDLMQQLVEPPPPNQVALSLERLVEWGALGPAPDYEIMTLGEVAGSLPIDVKFTKAIMSASQFGCGTDMAVIACGLMQQRSIYRLPMRPFYNSDYEFQQNVALAFRSITHFDRQRMNDLYQFLAILEEWLSKKENHKFCETWHLSFRQVRTFAQTCRLVCRRLVSAHDAGLLALLPSDRENMDAIVSGKPLRFTSLWDPLTDELLQIVLCQSSDRMLEGCAAPNKAFADAMKVLPPPPPSAAARRDVVYFQGAAQELVELTADGISGMLAAFGTVSSSHITVHRRECHIVTEMMPAHPAAASDGNPPSAAAIKPPRVHSLSTASSIAAICRFGKLHPSRKHTFASAHVTQGLPFPAPSTSVKIKQWRVRPSSGVAVQETSSPVQMDRWGIVGTHATCDILEPRPVFGCAFGMMSAGQNLIASTVFLLSESIGLPMLSVLCREQTLPTLAIGVDVDACLMTEGATKSGSGSLDGMWPVPTTVVLLANLVRYALRGMGAQPHGGGGKHKAAHHHHHDGDRVQILSVLRKIWDITQALGCAKPTSAASQKQKKRPDGEMRLEPRKYAASSSGGTPAVHLYDVADLFAMHSRSASWKEAKSLYLSVVGGLCVLPEDVFNEDDDDDDSECDSCELEAAMDAMVLSPVGIQEKVRTPPPVTQLVDDVVKQPNRLKGKQVHKQRVLSYCLSKLRSPWCSADDATQTQWCTSAWGTSLLAKLVERGWVLPVDETMTMFALPKKGNLARDNVADLDWVTGLAAEAVNAVRIRGLPPTSQGGIEVGVKGTTIVEAAMMRLKALPGKRNSVNVKERAKKKLLGKAVLDALLGANCIALVPTGPKRYAVLEAGSHQLSPSVDPFEGISSDVKRSWDKQVARAAKKKSKAV